MTVAGGNNKSSTNDVSQSYRQQIMHKHHDAYLFSCKHGHRYEIHVGDAMFKTAKVEQHRRNKDAKDLFDKRFSRIGKPGSQIYQDPAKDRSA